MLLFRPQMVGGPSWLVITEKVSVRQRDAVVISFPPLLATPFSTLIVVVVKVDGPVITKVSKSKRSYTKDGFSGAQKV